MGRFWWWLWAPQPPWWRYQLQTLLCVSTLMGVLTGLFIAFDYAVHGHVSW